MHLGGGQDHMLFGLERDLGTSIVWYIVPDGYGDVATASIYGLGGRLLMLEANETRPALVDAGRHPTGQCGFHLDETLLENIAEIDDLEIRDAATDVLIYRRPKPSDIPQCVIQLYSELFPPRALISQLDPLFQYSGLRLETHGHETITQFFHIRDCPSMFFSGRFLFQNYEHWIEDRFEKVIFVDDPYVSLAERLLVLSKLNQVGRPELIIGERDAMLFRPAIEFVQTLNLENGKELKRAMQRLPDEVALALADPLTRLLTCSSPTEMPRAGCLSKSLDLVASCAVVGTAGEEGIYADTLAELMGLSNAMIPVPSQFAGLANLANTLRAEARAEHLISRDLELVDAIKNAVAKASNVPAV